jgi:hypothetical protein
LFIPEAGRTLNRRTEVIDHMKPIIRSDLEMIFVTQLI